MSLRLGLHVVQSFVSGSSLNPFLQTQTPLMFSRKGSIQTHCPDKLLDLPEIIITSELQTHLSSDLKEYRGHGGKHPKTVPK